MFDFPAVVQGLYILVVIFLIITTIRFFRKPSVQKSLSKDNRALLLLMSLGSLIVVSLVIGIKVSGWKSQYRQEKTNFLLEQELSLNEYSFIGRTFKPLEQEYRQLRSSLQGLDKMTHKIDDLIPKHKNHQELLTEMLTTFSEENEEQAALYKRINLEIRNVIIAASTTQDAAAVQKQFYKRAKVLHVKIINSQKRLSKKLGNTAGLLENSLIEARRGLHSKKKTRKQKRKNKKDTANQPLMLYSFSDETAKKLLTLLEKHDANLFANTKQIANVIIKARQNKDTMFALSQRETELKVPLEKTMLLWSNAEVKGQKIWGNILYSLEAMYLAKQFNMPQHNPAYRSLMRDLKDVIPKQLSVLVQKHREVESSFIAPDFVENARKNRL